MVIRRFFIIPIAIAIGLSVIFFLLNSDDITDVNLDGFDVDKDGVIDSLDNCPTDTNFDQTDFDSDKLGDECDIDDDNDGISDSLDKFDTDPEDWADFDFDGIGSFKDTDDDNDGILDVVDSDPLPISESLATKYLQDIRVCADMDDGTLRLVCYSTFFGKIAENEKNNSDALELL